MINIALLGHGVVGSGTAAVLGEKAGQLKRITGQDIALKYVLVRHDYDVDYKEKFVYDFSVIENDEDVQIVVEAMGGINPALDYVTRALNKGKSVVTSNKELVAEHGQQLMELAKEKGVNFMFEAAVGGAVPVIHAVRSCLKANSVYGVAGILNGTTNYILTKMIEEGMSFDRALKQAQELGYAEADPSADVDGIDTCRKICILSDIIFKNHIYPKDVAVEGIRNVQIEDVNILKEHGGCVKLLGVARKAGEKLMVTVAPFAVIDKGVIGATDDVFNAVQVETDNAGTMAFYGRGAGSLPTASAVVNDICECVTAGGPAYESWNGPKEGFLADVRQIPMRYYLRVAADAEKLRADFEGAQVLYSGSETALLTEDICGRELEKKLSGYSVKSVLKVF